MPKQEMNQTPNIMNTNKPINHPSNNYGDMVIFPFFKTAVGGHLGFVNSGNLNR